MTDRPDQDETQEMPRPRPRPGAFTRTTTRVFTGLRDAITSPFTLPPSIWRDDDVSESGEHATADTDAANGERTDRGKPVPWTGTDLDEDGLAIGVPRPGDLGTEITRQRRRKRNLVVIGQYLQEYGRWRGLLAVLLLFGAIHIPALAAPAEAGITFDTPPFFLRPAADVHGALIHLVAAGGLVGVLVLPTLARGLMLLVMGLAPVVLYLVLAVVAVPTLPDPLQVLRDHLVAVLPVWIFLAGGLVALQSFPDHRGIRGCVIGAASVMLVLQFFLWGNLWTHPICAITGGLIVAMAAAALWVATRGNQWLTVGLVKLGWLYVVAVPALYYLWLHELPELQELGPVQQALAVHGMAYAVATFLLATLGLTDTLHALAWRQEVRQSMGAEALELDPAGTRFAEQFLAFAVASGRFTPDEITFLQRSLARETEFRNGSRPE